MIDLEQFPENEVAQRMLSMVSPIYDKAYVGKWLYEIMGKMMSDPVSVITELGNETSPETATWTLPIWENQYGIATNTALTLEQRRQKVIDRRNYKSPMNPARIAKQIMDVSGRQAEVVENTAPYTYEVLIYPGSSEVSLDRVYEIVNGVKQSNKHVDVIFAVLTTIRIRADPEVQGMAYPHVLAGTVPDVNTPGALETPGLATEIATATGVAAYKVCGAVGLKKGG